MHHIATLIVLLSLTVSPSVSFAPTKLTISVHVEQRAENRTLQVTLDDGGGYGRASTVQLEGMDARITHRFEWRDIPAGDYLLVAKVFDSAGKVLAATSPAHVQVEGRGE